MRWKLILAAVFLLAVAIGAVVLTSKVKTHNRERALAADLSASENWILSGDNEKAQSTLERILRENPNLKDGDRVLNALAGSYKASQNSVDALQCWQRIVEKYPNSEYVPSALSALAEQAYTESDMARATDLWNQILQKYGDSKLADDAAFGLARIQSKKATPAATRQAMAAVLEKYPNSDRRGDIEDILGSLNMDALLSQEFSEADGDVIYVIAKGDTLDRLSKKFKVSAEFIKKINHVTNEKNLPLGKRLKIPSVQFSILVDKTNNTLTLQNQGKFFKRYRCRTGKEDWRTPNGSYTIKSKVVDPPWNKPGAGRIPAGDAANALGSRWMVFQGSLGIHGTNAPDTIGTYASEGCVGLLNSDVEELFDLVRVGTPVKIEGKMQKNAS
jgi:outer membrane protein assembly factor BamD (BamD/ComL family)/LysM repeat protein